MRLLFALYALPLYAALLLTAAHCARWFTSEPQLNALTAPLLQWIAGTARQITVGSYNMGHIVSQLLAPLALDLLLLRTATALFDRAATQTEQLSNALFKKPIRVIFALILVEIVMLLWTPTTAWTLWTKPRSSIAAVLRWTHLFGWVLLVVQTFFFDHFEMSGVKHLYYHYVLNSKSTPLDDKSDATQRLYQHMRHPHLLATLLVLWSVPVMSIDRLLLATLAPLFLIARSALDAEDVSYVRQQLTRGYGSLVEHSNPWLRTA